MSWWAVWWVWAVAGCVVAVLEVVVPGYVFLGFAIGCGILAAGLVTGLTPDFVEGSLAATVFALAVFSAASWYLLRASFGGKGDQEKTFDADINDY